MEKWMVAAKRADFKGIGERFGIEKGQYQVEILDRDCGPANVFKYERGTEEVLISTNREIDEVAMYTFEK